MTKIPQMSDLCENIMAKMYFLMEYRSS
ncbi:unnamed protein product [Acanthoscelides obtectus]|uniref:Uncharacterized protein n=1 Tax=Acanthoscelides obtectus TaxID=200917 RepID=A0A9P0PGV2_ACAOB|nr:unnamed protein product [Acanthoscelides obtectus]CAK1677950.1 hypothetical protein AOBTE_LOCUS31669 [Acanthoscelides obtectus]